MKKLLLLPLVALSLVGCNDKKSTGWVTIEKNETLTICYNSRYIDYVGNNYSLLQYNSVFDDGYTDLRVKFTDIYGTQTKTHCFYGTNITYAVF